MREKKKMLRHLRRASPRDYLGWLEGFLARGGEPTHYYDYPMPSEVYVATSALDLYPLYGSAAIQIIAPHGIEVRGELGFGHTNIFEMEGYTARGGWVPVWVNTLPSKEE